MNHPKKTRRKERQMIQIRWIMLVLGIAVLLPAIFRGEIRYAIISFVIGMICGLLIDLVGVNLMHLWEYSGSKVVYYMITVPCWGIFGMSINLLWNWIKLPWLAFIVITVGLFLLMEAPNLQTRSWIYHAPTWLVIIGWIPLILSFRILYVVVISSFHYEKDNFSTKKGD